MSDKTSILQKIYGSFKKAANGLFRFWMSHEIPVIVSTVAVVFSIQLHFLPAMGNLSQFNGLSDIIGDIGSALICTSVVVISFIVFAMQTNVQRMPDILFQRFSKDKELMSACKGLFLLAIVLTTTPVLISDCLWLSAFVLLVDIFIVLGIFSLIFKIYYKSLELISPSEQLSVLEKHAEKMLQQWFQAMAKGMAKTGVMPASKDHSSLSKTLSPEDSRHIFLKQLEAHESFIDEVTQVIDDAISFAKEAAKKGDYLVVHEALEKILNINGLHMQHMSVLLDTKYLSNEPDCIVGIAEHTLKEINWYAQEVISRLIRYNRQTTKEISQILRFIDRLLEKYLSTKTLLTQAHEATIWLIVDRTKAIVHRIATLKIEGMMAESQKLLGNLSRKLLEKGCLDYASELMKQIVEICQDSQKNGFLSVSSDGLSELSKLASLLLRHKDSESNDLLHGLIQNTCEDIAEKTHLQWSQDHHASFLTPYYGENAESSHFFLWHLHDIANHISTHPNQSQHLIRNIGCWAESFNASTQQHAFLSAILCFEKKSDSSIYYQAPNMLHWVLKVLKFLLLIASKVAKEEESVRLSLDNGINALLGILEALPDRDDINNDALNQANQDLLLATLIKSDKAHNPIRTERLLAIYISWIFRPRHENPEWQMPESGLMGMAVFSIVNTNPKLSDLGVWIGKYVVKMSTARAILLGYLGIKERFIQVANNAAKEKLLVKLKRSYIKQYKINAKKMNDKLVEIAQFFEPKKVQ